MGRKQESAKELTRRQLLKYGLYGGLGLAAAGAGYWYWLRRKEPNIILIVIDTLRADHVGCYGYHRNTTPSIDQLAKEGILFRTAISSAPWTIPSIGTIMTSQYPCVLGVSEEITAISDRFPLLSELLRQHDYNTYGVASHTLVGADLGFSRGFEEYFLCKSRVLHEGFTSPAVTERAVSLLRRDHKRPFFLFLHYFDPHYHYQLHRQYNYYPSYKGSIRPGESILSLWAKRQDMSEDDIKYLLALYDSEIAFTDRYIGILLDQLKQQGLYDNSIIILTSDHGEEFMERGWIGHTISLYQELLRVPLIIRLPGGRAGVIDSPVGLIDIAPTACKYLGLKVPDGFEGHALDLSPGSSIVAEPVFSETFRLEAGARKGTEPIALRSIILGKWKLIYDQKKDIKRIYNLSQDPREQNDLSGQKSRIAKTLAKLLTQYITHVEKKTKKSPTKDESELFTPEERRRLESLGYL